MEGTMLINDIIKVIKKYFWIILLFALVGSGVGKMLVPAGPEPTYKASTLVLIEKKEAEAGIVINQTDEVGRFLNTAQTLIETSAILENVKSDLKLKESTNDLAGKIDVANENNSQIIRITAEDTDPKKATNLANTTAKHFSNNLDQYLKIETAIIVNQAKNGDETKILHTRSKANIAMGGILGLVFGTIIAFVLNINFNRKK